MPQVRQSWWFFLFQRWNCPSRVFSPEVKPPHHHGSSVHLGGDRAPHLPHPLSLGDEQVRRFRNAGLKLTNRWFFHEPAVQHERCSQNGCLLSGVQQPGHNERSNTQTIGTVEVIDWIGTEGPHQKELQRLYQKGPAVDWCSHERKRSIKLAGQRLQIHNEKDSHHHQKQHSQGLCNVRRVCQNAKCPHWEELRQKFDPFPAVLHPRKELWVFRILHAARPIQWIGQ